MMHEQMNTVSALSKTVTVVFFVLYMMSCYNYSCPNTVDTK